MKFKEFSYLEGLDKVMAAMIGKGPLDLNIFGRDTPPVNLDVDSAKSFSKNDPEVKNIDLKPAEFKSNIPSGLPVKGPISSGFGRRPRGMHYGTDFAVPTGTPIVAPEDGVVWMAGWNGDAGLMVAINSGNVQHKLMHLSKIKVSPGEKVKKGQVVALSGNTGLSTGPHLHWSKYVAGKPVDPMKNVG